MAEDPSILPPIAARAAQLARSIVLRSYSALVLRAELDAVERLRADQTLKRYKGPNIEVEYDVSERQRKAENLVAALDKVDGITDWTKVDPDELNPEFRYRWTLEAINVSDKTLQDLWVRLLAGELESPGSVSNATMTVVRDMTKDVAEDFRTLCSVALCSTDGSPLVVPAYSFPDPSVEDDWLRSCLGLMEFYRLTGNVYSDMVEFSDTKAELAFVCEGKMWAVQPSFNATICATFSPAGIELGRVVERDHSLCTWALERLRAGEGWEVREPGPPR